MSADKNLTGEQVQQIMDMLLYKALEPLILFTNVFDAQIEYLLVLIATNRKRKLSSLDREVVVEKLAAYLSVADRKQKFAFIRGARLERFFIHRFIKHFVEANYDYVKLYKDFLTNPTREKQVELDTSAAKVAKCGRSELYKTLLIADAYLEEFYKYRNIVIGQYIKNSNKVAKAHVTQSHCNSSYKDLVQSIIKSIIVALDKYDSDKGALSSYIATWAKNATTTTKEHEYGIAYTVPQTQRRKLYDGTSTDVNFGVSLDALKNEDDEEGSMALHAVLAPANALDHDLEQEQNVAIVQKLAKKVDPLGIARLSLDIGEYFDRFERSLMFEHMREEGLA